MNANVSALPQREGVKTRVSDAEWDTRATA